MQEEDEDVMQDAGGVDASNNTILQYNSSSHQAAMLNLAESHKQDSLPALQPGQLCSNVLAAVHLAQLVLAHCVVTLMIGCLCHDIVT